MCFSCFVCVPCSRVSGRIYLPGMTRSPLPNTGTFFGPDLRNVPFRRAGGIRGNHNVEMVALLVKDMVPPTHFKDMVDPSTHKISRSIAPIHYYLQMQKVGMLRSQSSVKPFVDFAVNPRLISGYLQQCKISVDDAHRVIVFLFRFLLTPFRPPHAPPPPRDPRGGLHAPPGAAGFAVPVGKPIRRFSLVIAVRGPRRGPWHARRLGGKHVFGWSSFWGPSGEDQNLSPNCIGQ